MAMDKKASFSSNLEEKHLYVVIRLVRSKEPVVFSMQVA